MDDGRCNVYCGAYPNDDKIADLMMVIFVVFLRLLFLAMLFYALSPVVEIFCTLENDLFCMMFGVVSKRRYAVFIFFL